MAAPILRDVGRGGLACLCAAMVASCTSDHRVSPWVEGLRWSDVSAPADLDANVARVRAEVEKGAMVIEVERAGTFPAGEPFVLMGMRATDPAGRASHAVRLISPYGIVLALGPYDNNASGPSSRTRLLESLAAGGWSSGTDFNADKLIDVVVAGDDGTFEIWGAHAHGASPYPMHTKVAPTKAMDIDDDGRPDPYGFVKIAGQDFIGPKLIEVMTFEDGIYTASSAAAKAWHARMAQEAAVPDGEEDGGGAPRTVVEELAAALESAWNRCSAGQKCDSARRDADAVAQRRAPLESGLAQSWVKWRGLLADIFSAGGDEVEQ